MVSAIREGAKAIVNEMLQEAVRNGNLYHGVEINDNQFAQKLGFNSDNDKKRFQVCLQYLTTKDLIHSVRLSEDVREITLTAAAIDFLEED